MKRLLLGAALALAGCQDQSMTTQPRYGWQAAAPPLARGAAALDPPAGVVAQDEADATPPPIDAALLSRGRERYDIFCAPCHGLGGDGDGVIVRRGFPAPASFHVPPLRQADANRLYAAIAHGYGRMSAFTRIVPRDRWAIVAYIRALQRSRSTTLAEAPEALDKLGGAP